MSGCLSLPLRLALLALLVAGGVIGWHYRREVRRQVHAWTADPDDAAPLGVARPGGAGRARERLADLGSSGRDSVVLQPDELASLAQEEVDRRMPGALDSIEIRLGPDEIEVRALVDTREIPLPLGPLRGMVRPSEPVDVAGRVMFRRQGVAEWLVDRVRVRGVPVPREVYARLLERLGPAVAAADGILTLPLPGGVSGLRVTAHGVTLYGEGGLR